MIRKLRVKFIIINMSLVFIVLLIVFGAMVLSSARQTQREADRTLTDALNFSENEDGTSRMPEVGMRPKGGSREAAPRFSTFCVLLDTQGDISSVTRQNLLVSDEIVSDAVEKALASGKSTGRLPAYDLCYAIRYSSAGTKLAFADVSAQTDSLARLITASLIIGFCGLVAFFGVSVFLSAIAIRPVARAWQQQRQFVADASHELKTPLTVILANTDILLAHPEQTVDEERRWVENTKAEGLRMKELVDELLYLARADIAAPQAMATFPLSEAVWGAALPFEAVAFENGVRLSTDIADRLTLFGNEQQIRQLVAILLDNAIQYAGVDGTVTIALSSEGDATRLIVHNTGAPIEQADLPHIFERFYRAEASRDRKTGGYGLGLSIAESIAKAHRAAISVESSEATGTTFLVEWRGRAHGKER